RHKAGPTGKKPALFRRKEAGTAVHCGAGFIPAGGGGFKHRAGNSTPLAGIKPAPQGKSRHCSTERKPAPPFVVGPGLPRPTVVGSSTVPGIRLRWPA